MLSLHERQVECGNFSRKGPIVKEKRHVINYIVFSKCYSYLKCFSALRVYKYIRRKTYFLGNLNFQRAVCFTEICVLGMVHSENKDIPVPI